MDWMLMPLRRYAEFSGRSRRREYWMFALFNLLIGVGAGFLIGLAMLLLYYGDASESAMMALLVPLCALYGLVSLALIIPGLAVTVRRLHDTDRSGWNLLWSFVPLVGPILLLVFYCSQGTPGPNRFGPDPLAADGTVFA